MNAAWMRSIFRQRGAWSARERTMKKILPEILFYFILFYFRVWLPRTLLPAPLSNHLFGHFRRGGPAPRRPSFSAANLRS
jgi:hypothetical protein